MAVIAFGAVGATASGDLEGFERTGAGALIGQLRALGHTLVDVGDPSATHFVSLDHNRRSFAAIASTIPASRRLLIVLEPRVVLPINYHASVLSLYGTVLSHTWAVPGIASVLPWPQRDWRAAPPATGTHLPGTAAIVNANKLSNIRNSLYGLRRRVIARFARERLPLSLAGANWERRGVAVLVENARAIAYAVLNREVVDLREWARTVPTTGSITHFGKVDDKAAVLLDAEFAVVIENSATYVSEKLFDAVIADCVPLYVGPPLADYGIPEAVAVILPPKASAFTDAVRTLTSEQKKAVLDAGAAWLASDETYRRWAMPNALARLADEIHTSIERGDGSR